MYFTVEFLYDCMQVRNLKCFSAPRHVKRKFMYLFLDEAARANVEEIGLASVFRILINPSSLQ